MEAEAQRAQIADQARPSTRGRDAEACATLAEPSDGGAANGARAGERWRARRVWRVCMSDNFADRQRRAIDRSLYDEVYAGPDATDRLRAVIESTDGG